MNQMEYHKLTTQLAACRMTIAYHHFYTYIGREAILALKI